MTGSAAIVVLGQISTVQWPFQPGARSSNLLGAAGTGLQLLLGPGTSGVDVTFILSVLDAKASRTRSTRGAPSARPSPPCARPSHPARLTHGSRTFPPPCTAHASLARRACTSPLYPLVPFCAQVLDVALGPRPGSREARRGGAAAAAGSRGGAWAPVGEGDRAALGRAAAASKAAGSGPKRAAADLTVF